MLSATLNVPSLCMIVKVIATSTGWPDSVPRTTPW
jgi:hypothetical protein